MRTIFYGASHYAAEALFAQAAIGIRNSLRRWQTGWIKNLSTGWTVIVLPSNECLQFRTGNGLERLDREIPYGSRVVSSFSNEASWQRLVNAVIMKTGDE